MHCVICSAVPLNVTARSVEFGSISLATCIEHPLCTRISFIFNPPFPISDPHWLAGTIKRIGICILPPDVVESLNCEHH